MSQPLRLRSVLYVVAKAPRAGHSKTRLCPPLTPEAAAQLSEAFLQDTLRLAVRSGATVRVICRDDAERDALLPYVRDAGIPLERGSVLVQIGAGLGAALECAFVTGLADGYQAAGVLGMDTPALPPAAIARAFDCLASSAEIDRALHRPTGTTLVGEPGQVSDARTADIALGPSDDGGYYLLAARRVHPFLFREMIWSTSEVAQESLRRCAQYGLHTQLVDEWADVDDAASLAGLVARLEGAAPDVAPYTRAALRALRIESHLAVAGGTSHAGRSNDRGHPAGKAGRSSEGSGASAGGSAGKQTGSIQE